MDLTEAIKARHSVRQYDGRPIEAEIKAELQREIDRCNKKGNLHIQLVTDEPKAFSGGLAHYGNFSGVCNYLALVGPKGEDLEEKCGYYGEKLVLRAQQLGLNTCWAALTYKKIPGTFEVRPGEKLTMVIAVGYGTTQGHPRKSKTAEAVSNVSAETPHWFRKGVEAALLAPTAINQQKFRFTYADGKVTAKAGLGPCAKTDLGIVKLHFELGAGRKI